MKQDFTIGGYTVAPGEKLQTWVRVPQSDMNLPVTILNGKMEGKTLLITAGIHGCEYPGIWTAVSLARTLDPEEVAGQIVIVHPVNIQAFWQRVAAIVPEDAKNINRVFPGKSDGTIAERIAYLLTHEFQSKADFYLDLHGGDQQEELIPYVYYPGNAGVQVKAAAQSAAKTLELEYMVCSMATTGAYNSAALRGIPSILIERGGIGECSEADVLAYQQDLLRLLSHFGLLDSKLDKAHCTPRDVVNVIYLEADLAGCWRPAVKAGEQVKVGQKLGDLYDLFGNLLKTYAAEQAGVVLYRGVALSVTPGSSLVAYGRIMDTIK